MRLRTTIRIITDTLRKRSLRETYWEASKAATRLARLLEPTNRSFAKLVVKDVVRFVTGVEPLAGETRVRAHAAVQWILHAQNVTGNGGVALGYFPCDDAAAWHSAYPETTGYIISTLLRYASRFELEDVRRRALDMARWEVRIQMRSGAVQGGPFSPSAEQSPCAFNTGMVLDGWCSAYEATADRLFFDAAHRAADFLIGDMNEAGYFRTNGQFVTPGPIKTYNCLSAWSMYRFGALARQRLYQAEAIRAVEAAIRQQDDNGWFANNCLSRSEAPLLHTISYTLQGILEVGILAGRDDFVKAVRSGVAPLLSMMSPAGFLPGRFYSDWEPASFSSCLTGSAQLAVVCYRLYRHTGIESYRHSADRLLNFLKPLQLLDSICTPVNGALAGSLPIFGEYMTAGYPNWATKYLLDALMLQDELNSPIEVPLNALESLAKR